MFHELVVSELGLQGKHFEFAMLVPGKQEANKKPQRVCCDLLFYEA